MSDIATVIIYMMSCGIVLILTIKITVLEEHIKDLYHEIESIKNDVRRSSK